MTRGWGTTPGICKRGESSKGWGAEMQNPGNMEHCRVRGGRKTQLVIDMLSRSQWGNRGSGG